MGVVEEDLSRWLSAVYRQEKAKALDRDMRLWKLPDSRP